MKVATVLLIGLVGVPWALPASSADVAVAWDLLPDLPLPRTEVAAAALDGEIYVLGGLDAAGSGIRRVDIFDPATGAWRLGPALPVALHHTSVVVLGTRLVALGGYVGSTFTPTSLSWSLDTAAPEALRAWAPWVPLPAPRGAHAAATDGTRVWIFGGVGPAPNLLDPTAYRLDVAGGEPAGAWVPIAPIPDSRDHLAGAFLGAKVYAVGGRDLTLQTNTGRLDVFDPAAGPLGAWRTLAPMPTPRGGIAAAAVGGHLLVFGGEAVGGTFDRAEAFDAAGGAWTVESAMPHRRHGLGAAVLGGDVHVVGGGPQPGLTVTGAHERLRLL